MQEIPPSVRPSRQAPTKPLEDTEIAKIFHKYDKNRTGAIEVDELKNVMQDLGLLTGRTPAEASAVVVAAFAAADADHDSALNLKEFTAYYRRATAPRLADILKAEHPEEMAALRQSFSDWSSFISRDLAKGGKKELGSAGWMKLCRDTGLVAPGAMTSTDADLIFAKVKPKGQQRINFLLFVDALGAVAARLNQDLLSTVEQIISSSGPVLNGTRVQVKQFYGSTASGAPAAQHPQQEQASSRTKQRRNSAPQPPLSLDISATCHTAAAGPSGSVSTTALDAERYHRSKAKAFEAPRSSVAGAEEFKILAHRSDSSSGGGSRASPDKDCGTPAPRGTGSNIEAVLHIFGEFAGFGTGSNAKTNLRSSTETPLSGGGASMATSPLRMEMDSKQFMKLCKDSGLATKTSDSVSVDMCFVKAKSRSARRISFSEFLVALALLAQEKGLAEGEVLAQVAACPGPRRNSITPEFCRLHDDKTTHTGVYARGGPKTVDNSVADLAQLLSREHGRRLS